ncbi:CoA-transferase family III [Xylaria bambusicola]|uniref:CoA-transferase family III n=1 Tax=Xylaria bambusicola TaxID=326684 RepID=UPI002008E83C|nr:CoA-transferase family III [Xylaria bambusicola]KAI0506210.1 CoA-transferase family III [Xylaria bambusicola]
MGSVTEYSVPDEAKTIFEDGILRNPLHKDLPSGLADLAKHVQFTGSSRPSIPINWRFAESISALKAFEASMLNLLVSRKYNVELSDITINTDHATLFVMSPMVSKWLKNGKPSQIDLFGPELSRMFPNRDLHRSTEGDHRILATNIYKTKDGRFYHVHGSMNPDPSLTALGLPLFGKADDTYESVVETIQDKVSQFDAAELDELMNEKYKQAGTIAWTSEEYFASEHGQANGRIGLYELSRTGSQPASWWPTNDSYPASSKRPLAGLKVVDLCRVIAGPAISRSLAEMGASVMRITSPHVTDISALHQDLNWGKWNASLHLKDEADKEKLRTLIREADVVVDGYRPGVMERLGFGRQAIFDLVKDRERGIIHGRENCYGWHGPWSHRSGWQQISDACCGVSRAYSKAMGNDESEAVTPVFPNSDYCTGVAGSTAVLEALIKRAQDGGSYAIDVSLNYYSQWLVRSCGTYSDEVWQELWQRHGSPAFRHYHSMFYLIPAMMKVIVQHGSETLFSPDFFQPMEARNLSTTFIRPKPVARFASGIELKYHVGTRGNGVDQPVWPKDLTVEVVTGNN